MAQKVITVNINVYEQTVTNRHSAYEIRDVNKYLDEGWTIKQCTTTPPRPPTGPISLLYWKNFRLLLLFFEAVIIFGIRHNKGFFNPC